MRKFHCWAVSAAVLALVLAAWGAAQPPAARPLKEGDLVKLLKTRSPDEVVDLVDSRGIDFAVDEAVILRLRRAGASFAVLRAVQRAGRPAAVVDYEAVLKLLRGGTGEREILQRLEESPTQMTLSADQVRELRQAGASPRLIQALQEVRLPLHSDVQDYALILDCSGSMTDKTPDGVTKMNAAKKVVTDLIHRLPDGRRLTFLVYGHNLEDECQAVKVVCAQAELDPALKEALSRDISRLKPLGHTPIALSLRMAGAELAKAEGLCELVLITDGMETCHGDPAAEARKLARNVHLRQGVHVIGFCADPKEQKEVEKIAQEGRGKYYDAPSAEDLERRVKELEAQRHRPPPPPRHAPPPRVRQDAAERARANRARLDAAAAQAEAEATKAARAAAQARESAVEADSCAEKAARSAKGKANRGKVRSLADTAKAADEAADAARDAAEKARRAAATAAVADSVEQASEQARTAAEQAQQAGAAAAQAEQAARDAAAQLMALKIPR
jgi:hypothetical protein